MNKMLYRERTLDEWKALPSDKQIGITRGGRESDFGFVADEQATKDAALGKAVRKWIGSDTVSDLRCYIRDCAKVNNGKCPTACMVQTLYSVIADALAAEEATGE